MPRRRRALFIVSMLASGVIVIGLIETLHFTSWDFRNNLWAPAYLLVHAQSPYHISVLFDNSRAVWLPMAPGLFFWLGWFTQHQATNVWLLLNIAALVGVVWLSTGEKRPHLILFSLSLLLTLIFPPTVSHLILGQFAIVTILALLIAVRLLTAKRIWLVGLLIALSLAKPQLAILGVPGILIFVARRNGWRRVLSLAGMSLLWIVVLTLPVWIAYPSWFNDFWVSLRENPVWAQPSLFSVLPRELGFVGTVVWLILCASVLAITIGLWLTREPEEAMIWSLAMTLLISPYVWSWDFVLLLPLLVRSFFELRSKTAQALIGLSYILCWGVMVWIRLTTKNNDERYWWLPIVLLACIAGGYVIQAHTSAAKSDEVSL